MFIEYIPGLERFHLGNYTEERLNRLADMLAEIHAVRVLWVDFDGARTVPLNQPLTGREAKAFWHELGLLKDIYVRLVGESSIILYEETVTDLVIVVG